MSCLFFSIKREKKVLFRIKILEKKNVQFKFLNHYCIELIKMDLRKRKQVLSPNQAPVKRQTPVRRQTPMPLKFDDGLKELVRAAVIKGLNPSTRRRVSYQAKIQLTFEQANEIKRAFNLGYKLMNCSDFMDEFRIIRANFTTYDHFSKIKDDSFKVAIRKSRVVYYNCRGPKELNTKTIQPPPYMVIALKRQNGRLNIDK
jgi:hypothetical protein